jgi:hypothetical protein
MEEKKVYEYPEMSPGLWQLFQHIDSKEQSLRQEMKEEIGGLNRRMDSMEQSLRQEISSLRNWMFIMMLGLVLTFAGVLYGIIFK